MLMVRALRREVVKFEGDEFSYRPRRLDCTMATPCEWRMNSPHAFVCSYPPRLRTFGNALIAPVIPQTQLPPARLTKRGTTAINYAEDGFDDDDFEDSEGPRRPTGLRSLRRDDSSIEKGAAASQLGK